MQKQVKFYADLGVDIFKSTISISGVTLRYLFKSLPNGVMFTLCSEKQKELHSTPRDNITGGSLITFHRYHENNNTCIREDEKVVQIVKMYDVNALYLDALMQEMPCDFPVIRRKEDNFEAQQASFHVIQNRQWLMCVSYSRNIHLLT